MPRQHRGISRPWWLIGIAALAACQQQTATLTNVQPRTNPCVTGSGAESGTAKPTDTAHTMPLSTGGSATPAITSTTGASTSSRTSGAWPPSLNAAQIITGGSIQLLELYAADSMHMVPPELRTFSDTNHWCTAAMPEFQDVQRFIQPSPTGGSRRAYGPVTQVVASPYMSTYRHSNEFDAAYVLVAVMYVWDQPEPMKDPYARLNLGKGLNCVYVKHYAAGNWDARVLKSGASTCPSADAEIAASPHVDVTPDDSTVTPGDLPPVARFVQLGDTATYVNVRCGAVACNIGAKSKALIPMPTHASAAGVPATEQAKVKGWFDDQQIGVPVGAAPPITPSIFATVVPEADLRRITLDKFAAGPVLVAQVYMSGDNANYARRFGFKKGWNKIELTGQPTSTDWSAIITDADGKKHTRYVRRFPHTYGSIPGTARWAWTWRDQDEWMWIACEVGCCLVQGGGDE